jgi:hypothetical protein
LDASIKASSSITFFCFLLKDRECITNGWVERTGSRSYISPREKRKKRWRTFSPSPPLSHLHSNGIARTRSSSPTALVFEIFFFIFFPDKIFCIIFFKRKV